MMPDPKTRLRAGRFAMAGAFVAGPGPAPMRAETALGRDAAEPDADQTRDGTTTGPT
jgi:hypothetical protein